MLIGVMVQQSLVGYIFVQGCSYYKFKDRDSQLVQYLVAGLLAFSTLEAVMDMHVIYRTTVAHYGEYRFFDLQTWSMWAEPAVTAVVGLLAQLFFSERCWKIMKKSWMVFVVLTFLLALSLGSGVAVSISFFKVRLFSELRKIPIPISFWLISTAVTDIIIAGILCAGLYGARTSVKRTETVLMKLIVLSVETSSCTAICAILNLVFRDGLRNDLDAHTFHDFVSQVAFRETQVRPTITEVNMTIAIEHALESSITKPGSKESQTDPDSVWSNMFAHSLRTPLPPPPPPLQVSTVIPAKEDAIAVLKDFLADETFAGSTWFTDGSLLEGSVRRAMLKFPLTAR
ncbi:hypothetical protein B0H11DRAFT_2250102 [Mycena galericulata]|nr:hypothetical protein B0H11DRAFT_2250102 [Mycena galericulata]